MHPGRVTGATPARRQGEGALAALPLTQRAAGRGASIAGARGCVRIGAQSPTRSSGGGGHQGAGPGRWRVSEGAGRARARHLAPAEPYSAVRAPGCLFRAAFTRQSELPDAPGEPPLASPRGPPTRRPARQPGPRAPYRLTYRPIALLGATLTTSESHPKTRRPRAAYRLQGARSRSPAAPYRRRAAPRVGAQARCLHCLAHGTALQRAIGPQGRR